MLLKGDPEKCPSEEYRKLSIGKTNEFSDSLTLEYEEKKQNKSSSL